MGLFRTRKSQSESSVRSMSHSRSTAHRQNFGNFTCTRLAAGIWMEKITFWQFGPGQNRNRGCDTIIQSNKTFSSRLFNAVDISGLIAFSKNHHQCYQRVNEIKVGTNRLERVCNYDPCNKHRVVVEGDLLYEISNIENSICDHIEDSRNYQNRPFHKLKSNSTLISSLESVTFTFFLVFIWNRIKLITKNIFL